MLVNSRTKFSGSITEAYRMITCSWGRSREGRIQWNKAFFLPPAVPNAEKVLNKYLTLKREIL